MDKPIQVNVITTRFGGPYIWGKGLVDVINKRGRYHAHITHELFKLLVTPLSVPGDIVHNVLPIAFHFWDKPHILTLHGEYPREHYRYQYCYKKTIEKADRLTTPSFFLKDRLNLNKAIVIPNGIQCDQFTHVQYIEKETINLLTISNAYFKEKTLGILEIIRTLNQLPEALRKKINYYIIGGGPYMGEIKKEISKSKIPIFLEGFVSPQKFLEKADIFLYYSYRDNMPMVILEAMASGLPVITYDIGAVGEMIRHNVDGFIAKNKDEFHEYTQALIENATQRIKMGKSAQAFCREKFDWDVLVKEWVKLYDSFK